MSTFPSVLSSFTDPNAGDRLNSPSHSSIEAAQNDALEKLETFVGTASSAIGTLMYNIRAAASDGGGHVQAANRGGTGQTVYSQGDILVATSASTLARLAVGVDNQILQANSSVAAGINWVVNPGARVFVDNVIRNVASSTGETTMFSTSILGSTLGSSNVVRATTYFNPWAAENSSVLARYKYAGNTVASVLLIPRSSGSIFGTISHTIIASTVSAQRHLVEVNLMSDITGTQNMRGTIQFNPQDPSSPSSTMTVIRGLVRSTSSVDGSANRAYEGTIEVMTGNGTNMSILGTIVEKIVP